jgi:hypothetical protein
MCGYGLPRNDDVAHPDKADIRLYGLNMKHKADRLRSAVKQSARRLWKRVARREGKAEIRDQLNDG